MATKTVVIWSALEKRAALSWCIKTISVHKEYWQQLMDDT